MDENELKINIPEKKAKKEKGFWRELFEVAFIVLVILVPVRYYIAQPFIVLGSSMDTSFSNGDYLIIDEISYRFEEPKRGDVVVFHPPLANNEKQYFIKRIIGLPEETVSLRNGIVTIINNENPQGFVLNENYVSSQSNVSIDTTLGPKQYFVMGDNRAVSHDSRFFGPLDSEKIAGRAFLRLFPFNEIALFPGKTE